MTEHNGHRQRLKQRFLTHGLDSLDDHNVLELLLFYAIPRQDTNALAHRLMERFGSLHGVLDAQPEELMAVPGVGTSAAAILRLVPETARRYLINKNDTGAIIRNAEDAGKYLLPRFVGLRDETVLMLCLDAKLKALGCPCVGKGVVCAAEISIRRVVELALAQNASGVILAHNHAGGLALPSRQDIDSTLLIRDALHMVSVELVDHLVVAGDDFISMRDSNMLYSDGKDMKSEDAENSSPAD